MSDHIDLYDSDGLRVGAFCVRTGRAQIGDMFLAAERTCRDASERPWQLWCSECGARLDLEDNDGEPTLWNGKGAPLPVNFCPNCGAKVVEG